MKKQLLILAIMITSFISVAQKDVTVNKGIDSTTHLVKKRLFKTMEASLEDKFIHVYYLEWFETKEGIYIENTKITKEYYVRDTPLLLNPNTGDTIKKADTLFTRWMNTLGYPVIIPAVNKTLNQLK